ncbi:MAG: polyphosphate polymerase domain-containing protein [Oscillospiraceae bacterium]|nr:polyphosphate polymerase domain-containing protein [Oscillospiraceae bacterium]
MTSSAAPKLKFERIEKKFWMSQLQYEALLPFLNENTQPDQYGETLVCNIYYDTRDYSLIRRSVERPLFKEKLRLRSYGVPSKQSMVFVELKRKLNGIGYKRRIAVPYEQAKILLRGEPIQCDNPQIETEVLEFIRRYQPQPAVYLCYSRRAMTLKDSPALRITIDRELRYSFRGFDEPMAPIMDDGSRVLMEIKAPGSVPPSLADKLSSLGIYQAPFSKVGACYTHHIAPALHY